MFLYIVQSKSQAILTKMQTKIWPSNTVFELLKEENENMFVVIELQRTMNFTWTLP